MKVGQSPEREPRTIFFFFLYNILGTHWSHEDRVDEDNDDNDDNDDDEKDYEEEREKKNVSRRRETILKSEVSFEGKTGPRWERKRRRQGRIVPAW